MDRAGSALENLDLAETFGLMLNRHSERAAANVRSLRQQQQVDAATEQEALEAAVHQVKATLDEAKLTRMRAVRM